MGSRKGRRVVAIDASVLGAAERLPSHCARHGRPAAKLLSFRIISQPGLRRYLRETITLEHHLTRLQLVCVDNWPFCVLCHRRMQLERMKASMLFGLGLTGFVGGFLGGGIARGATGEYIHPTIAIPIMLGLALMLTAVIPARRAMPGLVVGAKTTDDGAAVQFTDPHPDFSREMRELFGHHWPEQRPEA